MLEALEPFIREQMEHWSVPGLSVGLKYGNEIDFSGYGIANMETGAPVVPETLFQIGSISKIFTATLVMTLVDEGLVALDDRVVDHLPDFTTADAEAARKILIRHLLTHTGGFYGDRFDDHGRGDDALTRAVGAMADLRQQTQPGELFTYCNAGWDVLGRIVEVRLGMPFEQAMKARVLDPLQMERSTYFADEAILHSVAVGHRGGGDEELRVATPWPIPRRSAAAGSVISNVLEVMRFAVCHLRGGTLADVTVISSESAALMKQVQVKADYGRDWGLGWIVRDFGGTLSAEHNGATNAFKASLITIPARDFVIVVLTNGEDGSGAHSAIVSEAISRFLDLSIPVPTTVGLSAKQLDRFAGIYHHDLADMKIERCGDTLTIQRIGHDPFSGEDTYHDPQPAAPISETEFLVQDGVEKGSVGELFFEDDGSKRFLRYGGRLGYPDSGSLTT